MGRDNTCCSRRSLLQALGAAGAGSSVSGWFRRLAAAGVENPQRKRSCILLWMSGGPSQLDTFDLKPGTRNGGPIKPIETSVPGIQISEHLPQLAKQMRHCSIVRSMSTKEGDHERATYVMRTGYLEQGPVRYPALGSLVAKELGVEGTELPNFVSIAPFRNIAPGSFSPGFLGPQFAPLVVGGNPAGQPGQQPNADAASNLKVDDLSRAEGVDASRAEQRLALLNGLESSFVNRHATATALGHRTAYERAVRMMRPEIADVFDLEKEEAKTRDAYGRTGFGQGCLLARRLVEQGVPFVEVSFSNAQGAPFAWDTHQNNFETVKQLCGVLDPAWATLLSDLDERGLLDSTLVVWMGEFGRTPTINNLEGGGRDHFPAAWSTVLCGGGVKRGQVVGSTSADGMTVADRPVATPDFLATICLALGIDPEAQNISNIGRPIRIVDPKANPVRELVA